MPSLRSVLTFVASFNLIAPAASVTVSNSTKVSNSTSIPTSLSSTILILARDSASAFSATSGFDGYGIPYQLVIVPQAGITLPTLNSSATVGNYGGILTLSELAYDYPTGWASAITADQYASLYAYQVAFGVRMVRLDCYPGPDFGVSFFFQRRKPRCGY
jgi:hypothetical protein